MIDQFLTPPFNSSMILRKKKQIRRFLLERKNLQEKRIAILGGSTSAEIKDILELFLLKIGIKPAFYESGYNRFFEEAVFDNRELKNFKPDLVYIHTTIANITQFPKLSENEEKIKKLIAAEVTKFETIWNCIEAEFHCPIIQNNFELPSYRILGNLDCSDLHGRSWFINALNTSFSHAAANRQDLYLNDIHYLSSWFGLERWYDRLYWYSYKYAMNYEAIPFLAANISAIIGAIYGITKKCLVLDLDNTLWGGVIGDDGPAGIRIGKDSAESEAYQEFQEYVKLLKDRGILLAVCSKNEESNARAGFRRSDSVLTERDFVAFRANWEPKSENLSKISEAINIGVDSLVFVDDNPAERHAVRGFLPQVEVPELGSDVSRYITILDKSGYFEPAAFSFEDINRSSFYLADVKRHETEAVYATYAEYLKSLEMKAEIKPFSAVYVERIAQLTNKTNQFNLTTRRCSIPEIEAMVESKDYVTLYSRLTDRFGDNGLVSIMAGRIAGEDVHIDLWLMSCRVLKRGLEFAMFDQFVSAAQLRGKKRLVGYYYPTAKNATVADFFQALEFSRISVGESLETIWAYEINSNYSKKNHLIEVS